MTSMAALPQGLSQGQMENQLLSWFSQTGVVIHEQEMKLGSFQYHHFSAYQKMKNGGQLSGHGRSTSRKVAAIKCAAEMIERQFMVDFFPKAPTFVLAEEKNLLSQTSKLAVAKLPPRDLRTSNGWAVHFGKDLSQEKAIAESLERHLLLKSFIKNGWQGFNPIHQIKTSEVELYFYVSQFQFKNQLAGIVIAKSPLYAGVSFGYCLGQRSEIEKMSFWENAIFEAIDKILSLKGRSINLSQDPGSWLLAHTKEFLEQPFDLSLLSSDFVSPPEDLVQEVSVKTFDLSQKWNLPFPFFASFAWGAGLIPLFNKASLSPESLIQVKEHIRASGLERDVPERHPIL